jgi:hypothetical protein
MLHDIRSLGLALLFALATATAATAQHAISVSPFEVRAGTAVSLTVTSATNFDFSDIVDDQVVINPAAGVSNLQAIPQPDGKSLRVDFSLDDTAVLGPHTLLLVLPNHFVLSAGFSVTRALVTCAAGEQCCSLDMHGNCRRCATQCPIATCSGGLRCCEADPGNSGRCIKCRPTCPHKP